MGTRIKKNPPLLFEVFCEVGIPPESNKEPWITWKYPYSYKNKEILKSVPGFAYPCEFDNNAVQHFSFVLTNIDSQWTFGFCRHASSSSTCYVILSYLPWHEVFYKILNHVAELSNRQEAEKSKDLHLFLENLYNAQIPDSGLELRVLSSRNEDFIAVCPDQEKLPTIPENRNMTEYFNAVDAQNMMKIFASMLHERRILISSKKLSRLSACVQAANALIYPMHWQHIFIPVLPKHLSDYLSAPMPFLIGIPAATLARMKLPDMGDVVYLDADENKIQTPFADLEALPSEVLQSLRHDLKHPQEMLGDAVARAFLKALVKLIGGYWNALKLRPTEKITFSPELFIQSRPSAMQPFLQKMLELQIFQQFIDCRLKKLNGGEGVNDEFEFELTSHEDKASFRLRNQYRDWVTTMRKEGGAFFKNVKTKVKDTSKKAYKDIRSRIHDIHGHTIIPDEAPEVPKRRGSVPTTFNGHSHHKKLSVKNTYRKEVLTHTNSTDKPLELNSNANIDLLSPIATLRSSVGDSPQLTFQPIDVDLMGDLHEVIFRSCSLCSSHRTSISDPQLIDLSLDEKKPCGPDCIASPLRLSNSGNLFDSTAPPLLPRPPSSKSKSDVPKNSSISKSSKLLIELDEDISYSNKLDVLQSDFSLELPSFSHNQQMFMSQSHRSTNPFVQDSLTAPYSSTPTTIFKSSSGPNVKNMVNMWNSPPKADSQNFAAGSDKIKTTISPLSPYKAQALARTFSTPPSVTLNAPPSMLLLKSASKVSTNPFVVADNKNSFLKEKENCNNSVSSAWEDFH